MMKTEPSQRYHASMSICHIFKPYPPDHHSTCPLAARPAPQTARGSAPDHIMTSIIHGQNVPAVSDVCSSNSSTKYSKVLLQTRPQYSKVDVKTNRIVIVTLVISCRCWYTEDVDDQFQGLPVNSDNANEERYRLPRTMGFSEPLMERLTTTYERF